MAPASRWFFALKPASWPKLLVPMALGQAIGIDADGAISIAGLALGALFTLLDLAFVVLMNDWGDREVDRIKRHMFPQTSRKTIPDGVLGERAVLIGGLLAGAGALAVAFGGGLALERPWLGPAAVIALAIFASYTLPPLRLNYRGGGELLEGLGVGVVLPWINAYAQSGRAWTPALVVLPGFAILSLSSAVASGLSDERSDRRGGKRTLTTTLGNVLARRLVLALVVIGAIVWGLTAWLGAPGTPTIPLLAATAAVLLSIGPIRAASPAAVTDAFEAQAVYKGALHRAIWESTLVLAGGLALGPLLGW